MNNWVPLFYFLKFRQKTILPRGKPKLLQAFPYSSSSSSSSSAVSKSTPSDSDSDSERRENPIRMASIPLLRFSPHFQLQPPLKPLHKPYLTNLPHPLKPTLQIAPRVLRPPSPSRRSTISMSYSAVPATERLISAAAYCLPFFNGLQYGRFLLMQYPNLGLALEPILPILSLYRSIPYASFVVFFAFYLGVVRNPSFSRFVRFNSMQALVLDVLLVLPLLVNRIFSPGRAGLGFRLMVTGHNAIFLFVVACFVYSLVFCILGKTPYLPFVADAAGRQLWGWSILLTRNPSPQSPLRSPWASVVFISSFFFSWVWLFVELVLWALD